MSSKVTDHAPKEIYLQWIGDSDPEVWEEDELETPDGVTWCKDCVYKHDVKYVRADLVNDG